MLQIDTFIYYLIKCGKIHNFIISKKTYDNIDNLRKFHNFIKTKLIIESHNKSKGRTLLDIAVGRGGDLFKWKQSNYKIIVGFDPHVESLKEAENRLKHQLKIKMKLPFIKYFNLNALDPQLINKLNILEKTVKNLDKQDDINVYDVVSCQFALHYFTKTEESLNNILNFVSKKLKKGGIFIGTATDGDLIKNILDQGNVNIPLLTLIKQLDNNYLFYVQTGTQENITNLRKNYFEIQGVSSEYYLLKDILIKLAKKNNLELIQIKSFYEWYKDYPGNKMTPYEMIISFLNFSFIFIKK